jgi:YVTN family beta-propeller protein
MRLGIAAGDNIRTYSSIWQAIDVPADAPDPVLTFWYYAVSDDLVGDRQYALIQDEGGGLESVLSDRSDEQVWTYREYSLAAFKGHSVRIYFGVFNDGEAGITSMYVDDVAVAFCRSTPTPTLVTPTASPTPSTTPAATDTPTATPSPTPTPTKTEGHTPSPTATMTLSPTPPCQDLVVDGGFEWDDEAWYIPVAGRADYTTFFAHGGQRSMRIGIESGENVYSYSTVQQTVHVPADAQEAVLSFWYYAVSGDTENDLQYVLVKDQDGSFEWVLEERSNRRVWMFKEHQLGSRYRGADISLYFSVLNDGSGGTTAMYVDDVSLLICGSQPTPSTTPGTFPGALFLPVIVREYAEEGSLTSPSLPEARYEEEAGQPALGPSSFSGVRTLWAPAGSQVAPDFVRGLVLSPVEGVLYVAAGESLSVLDARSGAVIGQIPLPAAARGLAVDVAANRIYAALPDANALAVINASQQVLWKTVLGIPGASGVAVDGDHVYVTATSSDELVVVDRENYAIIRRLTVGDVPYAVACDPARQWVYIGNAGDDTVSIVDGRSGRVLNTAELGGLGHPHGLALDPGRARLYVTYASTPKYQAVASIDAVSGQVLSRLVGNDEQPLFGAYGIAVDTLLGRVYVTTVEGLLVLKGETLQVVGLLPGVGPAYAFGLQLDPVHEQLYVVDGGHRRLAVCGI